MKTFFQSINFIWTILITIFFFGCLYVFFQNTKGQVPKLSDMVLSSEETRMSQLPNFYEVNKTNKLSELGEFCKIDCVSISYLSKMVSLSITIIKSQTSSEANEVAQVFYNNITDLYSHKTETNSLLTSYFEELSPNRYKILPNHSTSLGITHKLSGETFSYSTIIVAYGNISIIVSKGLEACWNVEGKVVCDYEFEANPYYTSVIAAEQIKKLQEFGYEIQVP